MKKNNIKEIIKKILVLYILFSIVYAVIKFYVSVNWEEIITNYTKMEIIIECIKKTVLIIVLELISNFIIIAIYLFIRFSDKIYKEDKLTKIDYNNEEIYRDIIEKFSVAELGYIDTFEVNNNMIAASILELKLKGKLEFDEENNKILITNKEISLSNNEKYILDSIKNGKLMDFSKFNFSFRIMDDAEKNKLIENTKIKVKKMMKIFAIAFLLILIIGFIGYFIINSINFKGEENEIVGKLILFTNILLWSTSIPILVLIILGIYALKSYANPYRRTKFGESINKKLEGMKKYIREYSQLEEKRN